LRLGTCLLVVLLAGAATAHEQQKPRLVVCADPNNLPFSNQARQGFENKIAELIAREMRARIEYVWWAQRRGYVRNTLNEGRCDHHVPRVDQPG
jgi:mxaJ protein